MLWRMAGGSLHGKALWEVCTSKAKAAALGHVLLAYSQSSPDTLEGYGGQALVESLLESRREVKGR